MQEDLSGDPPPRHVCAGVHPCTAQHSMSSLEADLKKQILGRSKAEKVFRPWWDTLEDYLLTTLLVIGFLTLPTAYVTGNPVECVLHPHLWNSTSLWDPLGVGHILQHDEYEEDNVGYPIGTVRITHWYVKRYCTEKFVSKFVFYFPYILLIVPLTLVLVDRIFIKTFAAGNKIKQFYELLVEDSLRREDVATMSREAIKNIHELMQSFRFSNVCYWSYLCRTCLEIILSILLFLIYWCWGMPNLEREILCDVHGLRHSCVLPNHQFYFYILTISSALLCIYILCNLYNLVWIMCPQLGTMYRVIRKYQEQQMELIEQQQCLIGGNGDEMSANVRRKRSVRSPPAISTDNFLAVYFDRRHKDLKLLLNLLAETSGLPESFRILTLFDKKFQLLWKPQNLRFDEFQCPRPPFNGPRAASRDSGHTAFTIRLRWNDAPIAHFLVNYDSALSFEYTVDITPTPQAEMGLKSVLYKKDPTRHNMVANSNKRGRTSTSPEVFGLLETGQGEELSRYEVSFENIVCSEEDSNEYTVTISTELNGRTVTQMVEKFPVGEANLEARWRNRRASVLTLDKATNTSSQHNH